MSDVKSWGRCALPAEGPDEEEQVEEDEEVGMVLVEPHVGEGAKDYEGHQEDEEHDGREDDAGSGEAVVGLEPQRRIDRHKEA